MPWYNYVFNVGIISFIIITALFVWCVWNIKKKRYKFIGLDDSAFSAVLRKFRKRNKKAFKRHHKTKKYNKHEERCREIFEKIFGAKFKSVRPEWLKNPATGKNLELDGYCPDIVTPLGRGLCYEYDGQQHSMYTPYFHRGGPKEFLYQLKKDNWKDIKCRERGVLLIRIPHFVAYEDLERYIRQQLRNKGLGKYVY